MKSDGPFYKMDPIEIRPRPTRSFKDRVYAVAGSTDSVEAAGPYASALASMQLFAAEVPPELKSWE